MDISNILSLLEQLDDEIDDLEDAISPLVKAPLSETASKLPLLDKAKLYVLVTYAIESMLFSYLRLHGVKARDHPVFTELTRVKQYLTKIKLVENPINQGVGKRDNLSLDKDAVGRIIKAGLSGNDKYDLERAERQAKERARAHIKFIEVSEKVKPDEASKKRKAEEELQEEGPNSTDFDSESEEPAEVIKGPQTPEPHKKKKKKKGKPNKTKSLDESAQTSAISSASEKETKKKRKDKIEARRKAKKEKKLKEPGPRNFPKFEP